MHRQTPLEAPRTGVQTFTVSIRIARRSVNMDTTVRPRQPGHDVKYDMLFLAWQSRSQALVESGGFNWSPPPKPLSVKPQKTTGGWNPPLGYCVSMLGSVTNDRLKHIQELYIEVTGSTPRLTRMFDLCALGGGGGFGNIIRCLGALLPETGRVGGGGRRSSVPSKNVTHQRFCWERGDQGGNRAPDVNE